MANIQPFRFQLRKISRRENDLVQGLLEYLPAAGVRESFHLAIRKALQKYLGDFRYFLERIETCAFDDFYKDLPSACCVGVLGLEPFNEKAFVEIDPVLSFVMIEKLLGGKGEGHEELRPLTESEQGVVEFLILKLLSEIHKMCGEEARMNFRLEKMILEPAHIRRFKQEKQEMVVLKIHASLLKHSGFMNLYLPHPWIAEGFLKEAGRGKGEGEMKENLEHYADLPVKLWGELGETEIHAGDVGALEEGDVLLFDATGLRKEGAGWRGCVKLRLDEGEHGGLDADWNGFQDGGSVRLRP